MGTPQQFSLKWNNYSQHIVTAFEDLRGDDDLTDVTLSCEGKRIKAHKVLLSACSVYFKETFRENPCKHPVVILKGVSFIDLQAVVTFMYNGQVNISQERLSSFLQTAELLQIKGLTDMNDQEEGPVKKRPNTSTIPTPEPIITNVSHGQPSVSEDTSSLLTPEIVTTRPPTPKRKRIGPASFMNMQNLSQQNDSQVPLTNQTVGSTNFSSSNLSGNIGIGSVMTGSSNTLATSVAGPSGVSSSTGGLLNPETVILPSSNMMDPAGTSNTSESYSHGIIKFEEEEVLDEDDDYEKNNLSEDNDSSMHDMLGSVEQESNSLGSFMAGSSSSQPPIKIVSGGQDSTVHVKQDESWDVVAAEEVKPQHLQKLPKLKQQVFPSLKAATRSSSRNEAKQERKRFLEQPLLHRPEKVKVNDVATSEKYSDADKDELEEDEVERIDSNEDNEAEQVRISYQQEEFMSRLDLLRNPPPNVPITLPSLRPLPKLQRGTFNSLLSSSSHRNFLNVGLGHSYGLTTPNFSISQQLLKSAKATCRAKEQARAMISQAGAVTARTSKMSSIVGKAGFTPVPVLVSTTASAAIDELSCGGGNAADAGGPFVCDLCGKRYVHHRSLNDHKKFHTGATTCQYCNKAFSKVANLRAHMLAQHKDGGTDGFPLM